MTKNEFSSVCVIRPERYRTYETIFTIHLEKKVKLKKLFCEGFSPV